MAWLIQSDQTGGLPIFYAPKAERSGAGSLWTQEKAEAIGFASKADAQRFIDALLPRTDCRAVERP